MDQTLPIQLFFSSLDFSEISEGSRVNCFGKFSKGEGLNRLWKFTGQGTCSHIHSEVFLGNLRCFWDSVDTENLCNKGLALNMVWLSHHVSDSILDLLEQGGRVHHLTLIYSGNSWNNGVALTMTLIVVGYL